MWTAPSLKTMNTLNPIKSRISAVALLSVALTSSVWAASGSTTADEISQNDAKGRRQINPVYPYEMIVQGKSGWADTQFIIDYTGRPLFTTTSSASDRTFAKAAVAMVEANEFSPTRKNKRPLMTPATERFVFAGEASLDDGARRVLAELRKDKPAIYDVSELDDRPKALKQDSPVYPRALKDDGLTGQAEIEFVIDSEGRALFPRIVSASQEDFGWAAAAAVAQWRFMPPSKNGHKVDARVTVPVLFDARKLAAAD